MRLRSPFFCLFALVGSAAFASDGSTFFGPSVGVFLPSQGLLKSFVGETWYSFGFALTSSAKVPDRGGFAPDLYFISGESTRSKVFIASLSYGYVQPLGKQDGQAFQPYAAARAGLSYFDYGVQVTVADRRSAKALGVTGNVELGVLVGDRLAISARYDFLGKRDRLDFDGLSLQLSYGIIRF